MAEVDALFATLDEIEDKESVEAFVPVGAGSFIKGELKSTDEIIVSIGAGLAVKKDADGAREILEGQKEDLKDSLRLHRRTQLRRLPYEQPASQRRYAYRRRWSYRRTLPRSARC